MYPCSLGSCVGVCCLSIFLTTVCYFSTKQCVIWWKHSGVCSTSWLAQLTVPRFYVLYLWCLQQNMWNSFFSSETWLNLGGYTLTFFSESRHLLEMHHAMLKGQCPSSLMYIKFGKDASTSRHWGPRDTLCQQTPCWQRSRLKNNLTTGVAILRRLRLVPIGHTWPAFSSRLWALQTSSE